jgi:transposase
MSEPLSFSQPPQALPADEQNPGVAGAQRSEPERSGGERSAAPATPSGPATANPAADLKELPDAGGAHTPAEPPSHQPPQATPDGDDGVAPDLFGTPAPQPPLPRRARRGRRLVAPQPAMPPLTPEQRLLLLDTWQRSGLPAGDFAALVGVVSKHTLYAWKKKFDTLGPAGLMDQPRGAPSGSKLPELTRRTILMLKQANPDFGCQKISDLLLRGPALPASAAAVARVLHEAGYELEEVTTRPHPDKIRHFERAASNQLGQTDLFSFVLKRQNRRAYLVAFLDDHSRFITGYGLHTKQSQHP